MKEGPADHRALRLARSLARRVHGLTGRQIHAEWLRRFSARRFDHDLLVDDFDEGLRFWCCLNEHIGSNVFWRGSYSGSQLELLKQLLEPDMVFLDVGANQGEFTIVAASRLTRGRVIALEPVSSLLGRLRRNVEANGFDNVSALPLGLGERPARLPIYTSDEAFSDGTDHSGLPTLHPDAQRGRLLETIEIVRLDDLVEELALDRLDVAKLDVEGAELSALRGGAATIQRFRPWLLLEVDDRNCRRAGHSAEELLQAVEALGYSILGFDRMGAVVPLDRARLGEFQNVVCKPRE